MKVAMTFEFDDHMRRALAHHYGLKRPATRKDFRSWIDGIVTATSEDVAHDYDSALERKLERRPSDD